MNIEQLAIEHGILKLHEKALEGDVYVVGNVSIGRLEAFAKAYASQTNEPVAWVTHATAEFFGKVAGVGVFEYTPHDDFKFPLYTQPPNTVSLEQYNKLLNVLKVVLRCGEDRDESGMDWIEIADSRSKYISRMRLICARAIVEAERDDE